MVRMLDVWVGREARIEISEYGWDPNLFSLMLGASGGPKWLVLSQLDRVLFGEFLPQRTKPLDVLGTSIGSWRHACLGQDDPLAAIARMEKFYIQQEYAKNPSMEEVSQVSRSILQDVFGDDGMRQLVNNQRFVTHIGTVRGRGPLASEGRFVQGGGLALAALSNAVHRSWLQAWYQRVVFSGNVEALQEQMPFGDFSAVTAHLTPENAMDALLASASIPLTLAGVEDPAGAPPGLYWDGGIVDYHHDLSTYRGRGLLLYPHFYSFVIPGWLDKSFRWRRAHGRMLEQAVLISPSQAFVKQLPGGKIPDRKDFTKLSTAERQDRWHEVIALCQPLADELRELFSQSSPLRGVQFFEVA